ncbi:MAG: hypothetical protein IPJ67_04890 [Candidatus Moraniibacteriota bacterium]|nr:MAG: hypothetical protein IPJ67_04890 [Candidatus Moranbacteria bacterium]
MFLLVDNIVGVIACIWRCALSNVDVRSTSTAQQTRPSVDNWGLLSFVLNLGSFRPDRVEGFRLFHSSTPFLPSGIYFRGFVYRLAGMCLVFQSFTKGGGEMSAREIRQAIRGAVLSSVNRINLCGDRIFQMSWDSDSANILKCLLKNDIVKERYVREQLDIRLKALGRSCFEQYKRGKYPDRVLSPQALAYALQHGEFTPEEKAVIRFNHGDTKGTFVRTFNRDDQLLQKVFDQLIST